MDRSKDTYDMIKKHITFEDKIYYQKANRKECIGCLVKTKYADQSDHIELYLFERRTARGPFVCLDLIEYEKADKNIEQKKDGGWWSSRLNRAMFSFELQPKHQQQKEIFHCESEDNRIKWLKELNENLENLKINESYNADVYLKRIYDENLSKEEDEDDSLSNNKNEKSAPPVPPRKKSPSVISENKKQTKVDSAPEFHNELAYVLLKKKNVSEKKDLEENDIIYRGAFEELNKILCQINKPGLYAVSRKINPEFDCTWAIRVYEDDHTPISSWNIYQNTKTNKYSLSNVFDKSLNFSSIVELCSYYTKHDLPGESIAINRLTVPYKHCH